MNSPSWRGAAGRGGEQKSSYSNYGGRTTAVELPYKLVHALQAAIRLQAACTASTPAEPGSLGTGRFLGVSLTSRCGWMLWFSGASPSTSTNAICARLASGMPRSLCAASHAVQQGDCAAALLFHSACTSTLQAGCLGKHALESGPSQLEGVHCDSNCCRLHHKWGPAAPACWRWSCRGRCSRAGPPPPRAPHSLRGTAMVGVTVGRNLEGAWCGTVPAAQSSAGRANNMEGGERKGQDARGFPPVSSRSSRAAACAASSPASTSPAGSCAAQQVQGTPCLLVLAPRDVELIAPSAPWYVWHH